MTAQALPADADRRGLAPQPGLVVVKLGGSVVRSPELSAWLDVIAASPRPIVVVPGGGALADEVRVRANDAWLRRRRCAPHGAACHGPARLGHCGLALRLRGRRHRGRPCADALGAGSRCGLGALQPRLQSQRHSAILDRDLRQSRALARPAPRRRMLLCHQVDRAETRRIQRRAARPRRRGRRGLSRPCSRMQASPSSSSAAATRRRLPRASRRQATPLAAQPSTNANALSTSPSPRSSSRAG